MSSFLRTARSASELDSATTTSALETPDEGIVVRGSFDHAWCTPCRWSGPGRRARASAEADLDHHVLGHSEAYPEG